MKKAYIVVSTTLLLIVVTGCSKLFFSPTHMIQLEVETGNLTESQKQEATINIQNRLVSLGASNVSVVSENEQVLTLSYRGDFTPEILEACFSTTGNLEFFETCTSRKLIMDYFSEKYPSATDDEKLTTDETSVNNEALEFMENINIKKESYGGIFGHVSEENKERLKATSIYKTPIFISSIKKRVKFLLGKDYNGMCELYMVFLTSENEPHLDGKYITSAYYNPSTYNDRYVVDLQMNEEGAVIWEKLTEKVYNSRGYIAIVIDDIVYSAPSVSVGAIKGGRSQISGSFTKEEAAVLASVIHTRGIPKVKILKITEL
ncbi:SecDF P1 head subdomain-containing protein [Kordia sp.]|uniref:SecDF P1 head subdomain-containing protein n=1 Tax=Kordia sp. TaxID=1965332 RepID=UPI003D2963DC